MKFSVKRTVNTEQLRSALLTLEISVYHRRTQRGGGTPNAMPPPFGPDVVVEYTAEHTDTLSEKL